MRDFIDVTVVGGGASGALLAFHLLQQDSSIRVGVIEKSEHLALGAAYGTEEVCHLLNVPAKNMSAFADEPTHFVAWLGKHYPKRFQEEDFVPRKIFGEYLRDIYKSLQEKEEGKRLFSFAHMEVSSLEKEGEGYSLFTNSGQTLRSKQVVLAWGNFPPRKFPIPHSEFYQSTSYIENPWRHSWIDQAMEKSSICLLGSGLTSLDVILSLLKRNYKGKIFLLSKDALLPREHAPFKEVEEQELQGGNVRLLSKQLRSWIDKEKGNFRGVMQALRKKTPSIWRSLSLKEKKRFLRFLAPFWEVHRHRVAPKVMTPIKEAFSSGQCCLMKGKLVDVEQKERLTVHAKKGKQSFSFDVDFFVNCTGPQADISKINHPLIKDLLQKGWIKEDSLKIGVEVGVRGESLNREGEEVPGLFFVGPPCKARDYEVTAIPEIREQVVLLANRLLEKSQALL